MFQKLVPLNLDVHRTLDFNAKKDYSFASGMMASPVVAAEAGHIAREYVLVFSGQAGSLPLALLGAQRDSNAYVADNGVWQARYIPAHIRRYPFMLAHSGEEGEQGASQRFTIMIDAEAPHFDGSGSEPLFDEQGAPSAVLRRAEQALTHLQHDQLRTVRMVEQLDAAGLLQAQPLNVQPAQGEGVALTGMRVIDRKRFAELPAELLHELHRSGALALAHAHFMSLSNLTDSRLMPDRAASQPDFDIDELLGDDDGTLTFNF